jgi:polysaccharide export outer membrane protein
VLSVSLIQRSVAVEVDVDSVVPAQCDECEFITMSSLQAGQTSPHRSRRCKDREDSFMARILQYLIILFVICWTIEPGFGEPGPLMSAGPGKSPADGSSSANVAVSGEKGAVQPNKDPNVPSQIMEKLSNAVSNEYIIGAEDMLEITVWRNADLSKTVQVRPDGRISMPIIRDIMAVGKTPTQLAEEMTNKLKEYVQNPVVAVSLKEVNSSNVFVLGEVAHPGKFPLKSKTTLLQGITVAGGFTPIAARNQIVIFRFTENAPGMKRLTASYDEIVLRSGINENFELKSGDTVVVPSEAMVVFPGR